MIKTIYLNSGHSSIQPGVPIEGYKYKTETALNMDIRNSVLGQLLNQGFKVVSVPDELGLRESINWVNERVKGLYDGLALSIHNNCCGGRGAETFYYRHNAKSRHIAERLVDAYCRETGQKKRGAKSDTLAAQGQIGWIRYTNCWAVLIECGFVDNKQDMDFIENNIDRVAKGIVKGVCSIFNVEYEEPKTKGRLTAIERLIEAIRQKIKNLIKSLS